MWNLLNGYVDPGEQSLFANAHTCLTILAICYKIIMLCMRLKWIFLTLIEHNDSLFHLVYEKVKVDENKLEAHLWTFRPQINLEHLKRIVQADGSRKILDAFLQVVRYLREFI